MKVSSRTGFIVSPFLLMHLHSDICFSFFRRCNPSFRFRTGPKRHYRGFRNLRSLLNDGEFPCRVFIARIYNRIGNVLCSRGDYVAAVEQFELALSVYSRAGKSEESKEMTRLRRVGLITALLMHAKVKASPL
jgi:hypothetical protein